MLALRNNSVGWKSVVLGAALLCSGGVLAHAQDQQQTTPDAPAPAQPAKTPANPSAAKPAAKQPSNGSTATPAPSDDNAFPEAQSEAAQEKAQAAQDKADSADSNAFPEAQSEAAQKRAESSGADGSAPTPSNGEPYSSSRSRGMSLNDLLGTGDSPVSDGAGHYINNDKLAKEDIRVGKFYLAQGNYAGAYMRLKEATEVGPGNVDAVYLLAEAARKTSHLDEAETNYKLYLQVQPDGKYAKDSLKALKELAGK